MPLKRRSRKAATIFDHSPPATLATLYLVCILIGALALRLPLSHDGSVTWHDALFTSVSAVTVTGLAVVDTGTAFTWVGQAVILTLIQLGGLGLMTFTVMVFYLLGVPIGIPQQFLLREELNQSSMGRLQTIVLMIFAVALIAELIGTALLALVFVPEHGLWRGLWQALFHAVSSFNNAGFSLFSDNLMGYVGHPVINIVIPALFIIGGIGFIVLGDLAEKRRWRGLTLHSKMMLVGTGVLIAIGFIGVATLEWHNPGTLGGLDGTASRLWAAWFQAVSPRTAGFNTIDIGEMHDSTTLLTMALMVIGGGSTSTAGGIKVTTVFVLLLSIVAFFRRQNTIHAYGRSIAPEDVFKVMALATLSVLVVFTGLFVISISHDGEFTDLAFEVASAFGTAGLSRGATADLDGLGTGVIIVLMFFGRVGPLTLGFFLATRGTPRVRYPKGRVHLG